MEAKSITREELEKFWMTLIEVDSLLKTCSLALGDESHAEIQVTLRVATNLLDPISDWMGTWPSVSVTEPAQ